MKNNIEQGVIITPTIEITMSVIKKFSPTDTVYKITDTERKNPYSVKEYFYLMTPGKRVGNKIVPSRSIETEMVICTHFVRNKLKEEKIHQDDLTL